MKLQIVFVGFLWLAVQLVSAGQARACACCTHPGARTVTSKAIDAFERQIIGNFRFAETAHLSVGETDPDDIKGVTVKSDQLTLRVKRTPSVWTFSFDDGAGNTGNLVFSLPERIKLFQVDPHSSTDRQGAGGGPLLYKEWKLTTAARGTGFLKGSVGEGQNAALIFHGHGNHCPNAGDFGAWTIVLYGPKAQVTFFGKLTN